MQHYLDRSPDCSGLGEVGRHGLVTDDVVVAAGDGPAGDVSSPCSG